MTVEHVELLVEELSIEAALRLILPKLLGDLTFEIYPHQCKDELISRLPSRLVGYSKRRSSDSWFRDHCRVVVVIDRDDSDCAALKAQLEAFAQNANLVTRTNAHGGSYTIANRLAIEELEAWYFGDWTAVRAAYPRVSATVSSQAKYRRPDAIAGGARGKRSSEYSRKHVTSPVVFARWRPPARLLLTWIRRAIVRRAFALFEMSCLSWRGHDCSFLMM